MRISDWSSDVCSSDLHYERRPSLWVQPIGDWGAGSVELVEIPTRTEFNDNIVAYWRPTDALAKGGPYTLTYRLFWCALPPDDTDLAPVMATRTGIIRDTAKRRFVIDFGALPDRKSTRLNSSQ